jgi:arginine/lysine/ornithine decarboxylase
VLVVPTVVPETGRQRGVRAFEEHILERSEKGLWAAEVTEEIAKATGRISAELVTPYPPGIPALAPVEVVNEAIVNYFEALFAAGDFFEGATDQNP